MLMKIKLKSKKLESLNHLQSEILKMKNLIHYIILKKDLKKGKKMLPQLNMMIRRMKF